MSGKFLEKVLDGIGTGIGMPEFVNGDATVKRALTFLPTRRRVARRRSQAHLHWRLRGFCIPYETVTRWKGSRTGGRYSSW